MPQRVFKVICQYLCEHCELVFDSQVDCILHERRDHQQSTTSSNANDSGELELLDKLNGQFNNLINNVTRHQTTFFDANNGIFESEDLESNDARPNVPPFLVANDDNVSENKSTINDAEQVTANRRKRHKPMKIYNEPAITADDQPPTLTKPTLSQLFNGKSPTNIKKEVDDGRRSSTPSSQSFKRSGVKPDVCYTEHMSANGLVELDIPNLPAGNVPRDIVDTAPRVGDDDVTCRFCGNRFTARANRVRHEATAHSDAQPYPCPLCERAFKRRDQLRSHLQLKHGQDLQRVRQRRSGLNLASLSSENTMIKDTSLVDMKLDVTPSKLPRLDIHAYSCEECPSKFITYRQLQRHMNDTHQKKHNNTLPTMVNGSNSGTSSPLLNILPNEDSASSLLDYLSTTTEQPNAAMAH